MPYFAYLQGEPSSALRAGDHAVGVSGFPGRTLAAMILVMLAGCSGLSSPLIAEKAGEPPKGEVRIVRVLAREGLERLAQHRYEDASRLFNAGLKFSPQSAQLHFLNALTYHLLYLRGDEAQLDLAATGYELALEHDPAHLQAALQLGRLQFEAKRYAKSADAFRHATLIEPGNGTGHQGLAAAAYYARDLSVARAAVEKAVPLLPRDAEATRAAAMIYAALGEQALARDAAARFAALEPGAGARERLEGRLDQWRAWHAAARSEGAPDTVLAQLGPPPSAPQSASTAGSSDASPASRAWFDCAGAGSAGSTQSSSVSGGGASAADETPIMPSLPAPCPGSGTPRMTILDVAFIRTENNASSSHGVNLLENLTYVLSGARELRDVVTQGSLSSGATANREVTITRNRARTLGTSIPYSLNIANATDTRAEVLAKPSLVALDRMPSTFFSGRNVTLGIAGVSGSSSYVTDRPVGVSLSVTPTFIDDDTILLAVRVARSFVELVDQAVKFGSTLQTSKSAVVANVALRMDETLILSGLSEQEIQRSADGVPVLKDIPVLQYLFGQKVVQNFTTSVLVLITPRRAARDNEMMAETISHLDSLPGDKAVYRPLIEGTMQRLPRRAPGNLHGTYRHAFGNTLFLQFRSGDLSLQHWSEPPRLESFLRDLREMIHF